MCGCNKRLANVSKNYMANVPSLHKPMPYTASSKSNVKGGAIQKTIKNPPPHPRSMFHRSV